MADSRLMGPTISVVVPIYNVEPYLASCLNSIARQSYSQLQVVMVDDGSTDASAAVAQDFARRDPRFVLVQQDNQGLGAARNTGIDHADGEFLAFVDSDDLLPAEAYAVLHASLEASGSDLVTGVVKRFASFGTWRTRLTPFRRTLRRTHIRELDELLMDRIVTNKLWRRSFWDGHGFRFPEGVLYEDVLVAFSAQVVADAVDVVRDTVYWWRERGASITQRRALPHGVKDRVDACLAVGQIIADRGMPDLKQRYERVVLATELQQFLDVADLGTAEYRAALAEHVARYLSQIDPAVLDRIPAIERLKYHLAARGLTDELLDVLAFQRLSLDDAPTEGSGDERYGVYPFFSDPRVDVPRDVYRLRTELSATAGIHELRWGRRTLRLRGYAFIDHIDAPRRGDVDTTLIVCNRDTGAQIEVPTRSSRRGKATIQADQVSDRYDGGWFDATLNLRALDLASDGEAVFDVEAVVRCDGVTRRTTVWEPAATAVERAGRSWLKGGRSARAAFELDGLVLYVEQVTAVVTTLENREESLALRGVLTDGTSTPTTLYVRRRLGARSYIPPVHSRGPRIVGRRVFWTGLTHEKIADRADAARADEDDEPPDESLDTDVAWLIRMRHENDDPSRLVVDAAVPTTGWVHGGREFTLHRTRYGTLGFVERRLRPVITAAQWRGATVELSGQQATDADDLTVILKRRSTGHERAVPVATSGGEVTVTLPLDALDDAGTPRPLPAGIWDVLVEQAGQGTARTPLRVHVDAIDRVESARVRQGRRYELRDVRYGSLAVVVSTVAPSGPVPRRARRGGRGRRAPSDDLIVFSSWHGRRFAGDVRAVYEAIARRGGTDPVWVCDDAQFEVPVGASVAAGSRDHADVLGRAAVVVTDHLLPTWWEPAPGQRVIQTWHGTPIRRAALDLPDDLRRAARWCLAELRRQAPAWEVLVTPSAAAGDVLRRSTGFDGELLEVGSPRSDVHHSEALRAARATEIRRRLHLGDGERVVLWAPTARHEAWTGRRRQGMGVDLHLGAGAEDLGDDVVVLVHRHPSVARPPTDLSGRLRDVTGVHDVADLMLVADVLVSDYSSVVLDHLHTGKPVVLFMPDLEEFTTTGPGFAVDLTAAPPGPITGSASETLAAVFSALQNPGHHAGYSRLLEQFGGPDDAQAANRVADRILRR